MDGILLLNKPIDITSRDLVNMASRKFNQKKVGHTGTLDPFASGLMILTFGKATKVSTFLEAQNKTYIAELTLGVSTDSLDLTGNVIDKKEVGIISKAQIEDVFSSFLGKIKQIPPMYSAIKVNGEELYKKARRGEVIEVAPREVEIYDLKLLSLTGNKILFQTKVSKGTYIRTLGKDIADKLGCGGHLSLLTRISVGDFELKNAKTIEEATEEDFISIPRALSFMPTLVLESNLAKKVMNGVRLQFNSQEQRLLLLSLDQQPLAIYERRSDGYYYSLRGLF